MSETEFKSAQVEKTPSKRRWGKIILTLSLALNLLFVGAIVGAGWMRHKYAASGGGPPRFIVERLLRPLPADKQQYIRDLLATHKQTHRLKSVKMRDYAEDLKKAVYSKPFDVGNVRRAAEKLHVSRGETAALRTELLVGVLEKLTPTERREILESRFFRRLFNTNRRSPFRR